MNQWSPSRTNDWWNERPWCANCDGSTASPVSVSSTAILLKMLHWCSTEMILRIQNSLVNIYIFQNESTIGERNKLIGLRAREQNKAFLPPANEILGKVMFLPMSLIPFTRGDGVSQHAKRKTHLSAQTPPQADTNLRRHPPPGRHPPRQTPPLSDTMGYGQQAGGTHPTGMQSSSWFVFVF